MDRTAVALDRADDLAYVESLLERNDLPADDVRSNPDAFYVARDEGADTSDGGATDAPGDRVAVGGIEVHGDAGLLRSVVVAPDRQGEGYGTAVCDALEERAAAQGIDALYLLTTTAADFFAGRGYERIDSETAPPAIRDTAEFADLCPSSATAMRKRL